MFNQIKAEITMCKKDPRVNAYIAKPQDFA
jgi:hypothetical protein